MSESAPLNPVNPENNAEKFKDISLVIREIVKELGNRSRQRLNDLFAPDSDLKFAEIATDLESSNPNLEDLVKRLDEEIENFGKYARSPIKEDARSLRHLLGAFDHLAKKIDSLSKENPEIAPMSTSIKKACQWTSNRIRKVEEYLR